VLIPPNPDLFITTRLPYDYDPDAKCPLWEAALAETFEGDLERIEALQQWAGLNLLPNCESQTAMLLYGPPGTGKSVVCLGLKAILGAANVSCLDLKDIKQRFKLKELAGKLANIVIDMSSREPLDEGLLKRLIDGVTVMSEEKYKNPVPFMPKAKWTFATNKLPQGLDPNDGIWRRLLILPCKRVVPEDRKTPGMADERADWWLRTGQLPGMLNWAIAGLKDYQKAGVLRRPSLSRALIEQQKATTDPTYHYISMHLREEADGTAPRDAVYRHYEQWMRDSNNGRALKSKHQFYAAIREQFPQADENQVDTGGSRPWCWIGVRWVG
jgi:P4 family phage/plasmid primase-like protien